MDYTGASLFGLLIFGIKGLYEGACLRQITTRYLARRGTFRPLARLLDCLLGGVRYAASMVPGPSIPRWLASRMWLRSTSGGWSGSQLP